MLSIFLIILFFIVFIMIILSIQKPFEGDEFPEDKNIDLVEKMHGDAKWKDYIRKGRK